MSKAFRDKYLARALAAAPEEEESGLLDRATSIADVLRTPGKLGANALLKFLEFANIGPSDETVKKFMPQTPDVIKRIETPEQQERRERLATTAVDAGMGSIAPMKIVGRAPSMLAEGGPLALKRASLKTDIAKLRALKKPPENALSKELALQEELGTLESEIGAKVPSMARKVDSPTAFKMFQKTNFEPTDAQMPEAQRILSDFSDNLITEAEAVKELNALKEGVLKAPSYVSQVSRATGEAGGRLIKGRPSQEKAMSYQLVHDLKKLGYKESPGSSWDKYLRGTERWDNLDAKTGTTLTDIPRQVMESASVSHDYMGGAYKVVDDAEKALRKLGMDDELVRLALRGEATVPKEAQPHVAALRRVLEEGRATGLANGREIKYREDYLPQRTEVPFSDLGRTFMRKAGSAPKEVALTAEHARGPKGLAPYLQEKNPYKLVRDYVQDIGRTHYDKVFPEIERNFVYLKLLKRDKEAQFLLDQFTSSTGYGKPQALGLIASHFLENGKVNMEKALEASNAKLTPDKQKLFMNTVTNLMMENWIGLNPKVHVLQHFQATFVAPAEIGWKYTLLGKRLAKHPTEELKPWLERARKELSMGDDIDLLEQGMSGKGEISLGKVMDALSNAARAPGRWGLKKFAQQETPNRLRVYAGARQQFLTKLDKPDEVLTGMLDGQRRAVLQTLETKGVDEAAHLYGKIRSARVNFLFTAMDRPELLSSPLGRLIPFTSWSTNNWMRYYGDIKQGDYKTLAKRIVYPWVLLQSFESITGIHAPGGHPLFGSVQSPEIAPQLRDPVGILPGAGIASRVAKLGTGDPLAPTGFRLSNQPSLMSFGLQKLLANKQSKDATKKSAFKEKYMKRALKGNP